MNYSNLDLNILQLLILIFQVGKDQVFWHVPLSL